MKNECYYQLHRTTASWNTKLNKTKHPLTSLHYQDTGLFLTENQFTAFCFLSLTYWSQSLRNTRLRHFNTWLQHFDTCPWHLTTLLSHLQWSFVLDISIGHSHLTFGEVTLNDMYISHLSMQQIEATKQFCFVWHLSRTLLSVYQ